MKKNSKPVELSTEETIRRRVENIRACTDLTCGPSILHAMTELRLECAYELWPEMNFAHKIAHIEDDPVFPEYFDILVAIGELFVHPYSPDNFLILPIESAKVYFSKQANALFFQHSA